MIISGKVKDLQREKVHPPNDGVHVAGADGFIKGVRNILIDGKQCPRGMVGFYWKVSDIMGVKVYYSFKHCCNFDTKKINKTFKRMKKLHALGLSPKPVSLEHVDINFEYNGTQINRQSIGLFVEHVCYPERTWNDYANGLPYRWEDVQDENHNPKSFIEFVNHAKKIIKKNGIRVDTSFKLGDVVYDTKKKRWFICDCD